MEISIRQMLTEKAVNIQYDLQIMYYSHDVDSLKKEKASSIDHHEDILHLTQITLM